ncbi:phasin family protein [Janthinobacterium kumbetense]|uniref:Phasin family protein n=1 Tax=Janthinobacterium kumbetense TaxID=2950280 RepID=A0ABT0WYR3_9BURK|nr:phasin family protein [Janthinobacterium kumbetense]MCM2569170.1 phasin family protein [Janthinobacterium kumbetense]
MFTNSISPSFSPALKSHLEAQCNFATELSRKLVDTAQQLSELHLRLAQDLLQEWSSASQQLLCARDTGEFMSLAAAQLQPSSNKLQQYQQQLGNLVANANVEMNRTAENHLPEARRTAVAFADEVVRKTAEETEKATQRQREMIERMHATAPSNGAGRSRDTGRQSDQAH